MTKNFKVCRKDVEVNGITLVVCAQAVCDGCCGFTVETVPCKVSKVKSYFYPEQRFMESFLPQYAENMVKAHKEDGKKFFVVTSSVTLIRAIECLTDLYDVMEDLDVYHVSLSGQEFAVENIMYGEYGISSLYDEILAPLNSIEDRLKEKYKE